MDTHNLELVVEAIKTNRRESVELTDYRDRLIRQAADAGVSPAELARITGLSKGRISQIIHGTYQRGKSRAKSDRNKNYDDGFSAGFTGDDAKGSEDTKAKEDAAYKRGFADGKRQAAKAKVLTMLSDNQHDALIEDLAAFFTGQLDESSVRQRLLATAKELGIRRKK